MVESGMFRGLGRDGRLAWELEKAFFLRFGLFLFFMDTHFLSLFFLRFQIHSLGCFQDRCD